MTLFLLSCILVAAHMVETVTGFGATVIALSLGVHLVDVRELVAALVLVAWIQSAWILLRSFRHTQGRLLFTRILPACALGFPLGIWCFRALGGEGLKVLLGVFVTAVASMELRRLYRKNTAARPLSRPAGFGLLAAGGFFHGLFASGGPLIVYYASRALQDKTAFRVTLSALWLILNSVLIAFYIPTGRMAGQAPALALCLLPAVALGILSGEILHSRVNEETFRKIVQIVLLFTGLTLLVQPG
jgi:uncharacterized membrane protein YfcA